MAQADSAGLARSICDAERAAIARALNLLDDHRPAAQEQAAQLLQELAARCREPHRRLVGMTGPPGVGKSSLSAALIRVWRERGLRVGVLAVDPSSPVSGGALLGDRLRMKTAGDDDGVFVRSLSSRGEFGGLSAQVWPMSLVLLAACDLVLVETVGVGQREIDVAATCDTTCFVAQPGSGDSIQFLKAGVLEVPHILVVNKQDLGSLASRTLTELRGALGNLHPDGDWQVPILSTSATEHTGIEALADAIEAHHRWLVERGELAARRRGAQARWVLRRLEQEYGRAGIARLGGEQALLARLAASEQNPFSQYETCRGQLQATA
ncbi:MAG: methylmalonyl Co-A mutase-associated GTPase MeaB [Halioglobus sp.]|nr:methylmalonyl Co-A mutase-associated GTPase MeaB [Halioglobus sp.]